MRKTRLRKLADTYGDTNCVLAPATIDPVVYLLAEMGETAFGPDFVDDVWGEIQMTQGEFPRKQALEIVANEFFKALMAEFALAGKPRLEDFARKVKELPPLNDKTYVDYFVLFTTIDQQVFNTPLQRACPNVQTILSAYQTESPLPVCEGVSTFFLQTNNARGYHGVIKKLCDTIKEQA